MYVLNQGLIISDLLFDHLAPTVSGTIPPQEENFAPAEDPEWVE